MSRLSSAGLRPVVWLTVLGKLSGLVWFVSSPLAGWLLFHAWGVFFVFFGMAPRARGLGPVISRFATDRREVWLTIDDGPDPDDTPRILEALRRHDARATFFVVGERAAKHPELIAAIRAAGHGLANHTHTHPVATFWAAGPRRIARELDRADAALRAAGAEPIPAFRAPAGMKSPFLHAALAARGLRCVEWSIRSGDTMRRSPESTVRSVMGRVKPGDIVLMHEGPSVCRGARVAAVAGVLDALDRDGWRCVVPDADRFR